jgi:NitT/TauT family transport system substrate-binding protein
MTKFSHSRMRLLTALTAAGLALAIAAPAAAADAKPWRHGIIKAKADGGFFMMATKGGFAEKLGLTVKTLEVKNDQIGLKAMLAGELDSYEGGPGGAIAAAARGADVKVIGCHWLSVPHGIMVHDNITSLNQLKGKSMAVSAPGSMPDILARAALAKYGLSDKDIKLASVGGDRDRYQALIGGVVQAAVVSNEYLPLKSAKGLKMLIQGHVALPKFLRTCIMSTGKVLKERRADAVKFMTAEMNALHFALTHRAETIALTRKVIKAKPDDPRPAFVYDETLKSGAVAPDVPVPLDKLAWMEDEMVKLGKLKKAVDIKTIVDSSIRDEAAKHAGKM